VLLEIAGQEVGFGSLRMHGSRHEILKKRRRSPTRCRVVTFGVCSTNCLVAVQATKMDMDEVLARVIGPEGSHVSLKLGRRSGAYERVFSVDLQRLSIENASLDQYRLRELRNRYIHTTVPSQKSRWACWEHGSKSRNEKKNWGAAPSTFRETTLITEKAPW